MSSASPWPRPFSYFLSPKGLGREAKRGGLAGPPAAERGQLRCCWTGARGSPGSGAPWERLVASDSRPNGPALVTSNQLRHFLAAVTDRKGPVALFKVKQDDFT